MVDKCSHSPSQALRVQDDFSTCLVFLSDSPVSKDVQFMMIQNKTKIFKYSHLRSCSQNEFYVNEMNDYLFGVW